LLVDYANNVTKTETNEKDEEGGKSRTLSTSEREIAFMKGHMVFNVGQIAGPPAHHYSEAETLSERMESAENFMVDTQARSAQAS
jgi:antirestriction protein ArdC